jgi:aminodeoxyfutalosine deaminase
MNEFPQAYARALPKAELHVHLEGTVDAATLLDLAARHDVDPPASSVQDVEDWYHFADFDEFLKRYFRIIDLLRTPDDFALIAERYLRSAHEQGAVHVEFHVSATGHLVESGHRWAPVQEGIVAGCAAAATATGISWALIPDISPHLGAAETFTALEEVVRDRHESVVAIGMGGPARPHWWEKDYRPFFDLARAAGLHAVSHAGEHGGAEEVRFAIEQFGAERIQHGIGAMGDPAVVQLLLERDVACDVCPGSNLALGAVPSAEAHPLAAMLEAGIKVTLASDDPPLFHTTLLDEYERAWRWCGLDEQGLRLLARNSLSASFAPEPLKAEWVAGLG